MFTDILQLSLQRSYNYRMLIRLQEQRGNIADEDDHFQQRRERSQGMGSSGELNLYNMTVNIGREMFDGFGPLGLWYRLPEDAIVLDMGMAPGGFSEAILRDRKHRHVYAITRPEEIGCKVLCPLRPNLTIAYGDVKAYVGEINPAHKDETAADVVEEPVSYRWPYGDTRFDLIICGAQGQYQADGIAPGTGNPVLCVRYAQMYIALRKLRPGGCFVIILDKSTKPRTMAFVHLVSRFATIQLFKPKRAFREKGMFYLVAINVNTESPEAEEMRRRLGQAWLAKGVGKGLFEVGDETSMSDEEARAVVTTFGEEYNRLAEPVWDVQFQALENPNRISPTD